MDQVPTTFFCLQNSPEGTLLYLILLFFSLIVLEVEPIALCMLGKHSTNELQPQPYSLHSGMKFRIFSLLLRRGVPTLGCLRTIREVSKAVDSCIYPQTNWSSSASSLCIRRLRPSILEVVTN